MYFGKNILKYKEDILKDLKTLISFQSISGENQGSKGSLMERRLNL